ncbi:MAG: hypothetical protein Kow00129_06300 [Thermoleophilia bacterium]
MARSFARAQLVGNLTQDPELRQLPSGTSVCELRVAVNTSYRDSSGQWQERPNYFSVKVFGGQGEACARYLNKGRQVAVQGRLDYQQWEGQDGSKRSKVEIVADDVVFMGGGGGDSGGGAGNSYSPPSDIAPADDFKDIDFGEDDDIPF